MSSHTETTPSFMVGSYNFGLIDRETHPDLGYGWYSIPETIVDHATEQRIDFIGALKAYGLSAEDAVAIRESRGQGNRELFEAKMREVQERRKAEFDDEATRDAVCAWLGLSADCPRERFLIQLYRADGLLREWYAHRGGAHDHRFHL